MNDEDDTAQDPSPGALSGAAETDRGELELPFRLDMPAAGNLMDLAWKEALDPVCPDWPDGTRVADGVATARARAGRGLLPRPRLRGRRLI